MSRRLITLLSLGLAVAIGLAPFLVPSADSSAPAAQQDKKKEKSKEPQAAPVPARKAAGRMSLPEGFRATLFAGEPDVVQPMAFTIDDRGRLWVVECLGYPKWSEDGQGNDRVLIFEDRDGDGEFDSRKVFLDNGVNLTGIEVGFGGIWLCSSPNFLFVPDADGDDKPDGRPQVLLDGWSLKCKHNVFNGLTWGPDGWLYGMNGIIATSLVGKPGTPEEKRTPLNCGVWRYHPTRHAFEPFAWGTTNPWGLDFDAYGQMFITNCVIKHLFHVVPGAHFERMYGQDLNAHTYGLIESCADHIHWGGGKWTTSRGGHGKHDKPGGGHAHVGAMVYLGDNWPDKYRGNLYTCNLHGLRVNCDSLVHRGSGYVAKHGKDFLFANDEWFRGLELKYGPDGGVYITDWSDTGECHDYDHCDRSNGRIHKITFGDPEPVRVNVEQLSDAELVRLHAHKNEWYVRHARRVLQERASLAKLEAGTRRRLETIVQSKADVTQRLRALWTVHATGGLSAMLTTSLLNDADPHVRSWTVRLALDDKNVSASHLKQFELMAKKDASPVVRLNLASGLQRLPLDQRWSIVEGLLSHAEDAKDAYLPLMIWYGMEPLVPADKTRAIQLVVKSKIPLIREYIARRVASLSK
jgi:putative membrane-bound dehydrogenase-like protein